MSTFIQLCQLDQLWVFEDQAYDGGDSHSLHLMIRPLQCLVYDNFEKDLKLQLVQNIGVSLLAQGSRFSSMN